MQIERVESNPYRLIIDGCLYVKVSKMVWKNGFFYRKRRGRVSRRAMLLGTGPGKCRAQHRKRLYIAVGQPHPDGFVRVWAEHKKKEN